MKVFVLALLIVAVSAAPADQEPPPQNDKATADQPGKEPSPGSKPKFLDKLKDLGKVGAAIQNAKKLGGVFGGKKPLSGLISKVPLLSGLGGGDGGKGGVGGLIGKVPLLGGLGGSDGGKGGVGGLIGKVPLLGGLGGSDGGKGGVGGLISKVPLLGGLGGDDSGKGKKDLLAGLLGGLKI